jgi:hypothetical protein
VAGWSFPSEWHVKVRNGVEILTGRFLLDHFADSLVGWDPTSSGLAGIGIGSSTPVPITSASLSTPLQSRTRQGVPGSSTKIDSVHALSSQKAPSTSKDLLTPQKRISDVQHTSSSLTPEPGLTPGPRSGPHALSPAGSATPTSPLPLVPLHFMRKASESPPVRQREKEKLGVGRRSILGKSPSGNVAADVSPSKATS